VPETGRPEATIIFAGARFAAKMRPTPSAPGSFVVEDFDGEPIAEGIPEDDGDEGDG
jgi:hypothetical protein